MSDFDHAQEDRRGRARDGSKGSRGVVTARGWWVGVEPGQRVESSHYMQIPADALSISRGRHVEVVYGIKVSIGSSLSADVSVELPLRVINFVSLDPPPPKKAGGGILGNDATRSWGAPGSTPNDAASPSDAIGRATVDDADRKIARLKSVDAMRSPARPRSRCTITTSIYKQLDPVSGRGRGRTESTTSAPEVARLYQSCHPQCCRSTRC